MAAPAEQAAPAALTPAASADTAKAAARYRVPIALHNVSGLLLNLASQQLAAATFDCPRIECSKLAHTLPWAKPNPLVIRNGRMKVSTAPGLGFEPDLDFLRSAMAPGEPWWG